MRGDLLLRFGRVPPVPQHEQLIIAAGAEHVRVVAVELHILHNALVPEERRRGVRLLAVALGRRRDVDIKRQPLKTIRKPGQEP